MAFCENCGQKLNPHAKFCPACGEAATNVINDAPSERKSVYEGVIHKCPNCGEVLNAFIATCPACGYEVRERKASSSVQELASKLEEISSFRSKKDKRKMELINEEKASLIRTFAIPNTKEDIYEFMILAVSNIDPESYSDDDIEGKQKVSDAWVAKFEQAFQKAQLTFSNDPKLFYIKQLFLEKTNQIALKKRNNKRSNVYFVIFAFVFLLFSVSVLFLWMYLF